MTAAVSPLVKFPAPVIPRITKLSLPKRKRRIEVQNRQPIPVIIATVFLVLRLVVCMLT